MANFKKDDHSKPRYDLIPPHAELELAHVLTMGAEKYGANNWHQGGPESIPRYIAAAQRHIAAYRRGEELDGESGYQHLAHAVASLMFVLEFECEDAGWIEGAAEDVGPSKVWSYADGELDVTIWNDGQRLFANLTHGNRQVKYADGFEDVLDGLGRIQGKCESGEYCQFMNQAIAALRRSYGLL